MITTLPTIDAATRREFLAIMAVAGLLTACGSDDDSGSGGDTRTVETANGPVDVPTNPQRAASTFYPALIGLAMLGVPVVAAVRSSLLLIADLPAAFVPPGLDGLTDIGSGDSPNLETLAATRPDLLIEQDGRDQAVLDAMAGIAPTVALEYPGDPSWREYAAAVARVVGRQDRLAEIVERFDTAAAAARTAVPNPPAFAVISGDVGDGQFKIYVANSFEGQVLAAAGIDVLTTGGPATADGGFVEHSVELLGEVLGGAELILVRVFADNPGIAAYAGNPLWEQLPAVRAVRVREVRSSVWGGSTYPSAFALLDELPRVLAS